MSSSAESSLEIAARYLDAVARGAVKEELAAFLHDQIEQQELPNRFLPTGKVYDKAGMLAAAERGQTAMKDQRWEITSTIAEGDRVAVEVAWSGTVAVDVGPLKSGDVMRARIAIFLEIRAGRIYRQRNYDCYDAFGGSSTG